MNDEYEYDLDDVLAATATIGIAEDGLDLYETEKETNIRRMRANLENGCEAISGLPMEGETLKAERQMNRQAQLLARTNAQKKFRGER